MRAALKFLLVVLMFGLYVLLCQVFYQLLDQRLCHGVDGFDDTLSTLCNLTGTGSVYDLGMNSPYWFWLIILGMPATLVAAIAAGMYNVSVWLQARRAPRDRYGPRRRRHPVHLL